MANNGNKTGTFGLSKRWRKAALLKKKHDRQRNLEGCVNRSKARREI